MNLTPYIPLSLQGRVKERGRRLERGIVPFLLGAEHFDDIFCQAISYFAVSGNRLGNSSIRVLIPIVAGAVAY
jgi:hypothetical protein